jgi:hypothetical protein
VSEQTPAMKLFVWADPYRISYGTSMVFAVAETVEQAREIAAAQTRHYSYAQYASEPHAAYSGSVKLGEPTRVVDLPCAEWHEWSE